ncbi:hypothetical protein AVEN_255227-1 [Araneus ventricosus]|uniref:Uncharacterized protein n=1 Tax=Araneus ventricosus TaxID=182803 RepID=A0A4Y2BA47_ARAVE|nr:hypothetical protein AVEN_255227-1 [Araneus ventricosus]
MRSSTWRFSRLMERILFSNYYRELFEGDSAAEGKIWPGGSSGTDLCARSSFTCNEECCRWKEFSRFGNSLRHVGDKALESLGRTKEKFVDFLEPLVESCLPESVLRAFERSKISGDADASKSRRSLEKLMSFLRHEIESEEIINLAREGFVKNGGLFKRNKSAVLDATDTATTAMLVSTNPSYDGASTGKKNCVFCKISLKL